MKTKRRMVSASVAAAAMVAGLLVAATPASTEARVSTRTLLAQLTVRPEHAAGYARSEFDLWIDADHDGCNTRAEVLLAEAKVKAHVGARCTLTGGLWVSPYDGVTVTNSSRLDIDHLVPLAEAWQSGAYAWNADTRKRYANDLGYPADLVAVTAHANRSKGDDEPSAYLPPKKSFDCTYEAWWVAVKWRWHLSVSASEKTWLTIHLLGCGWPTVARPGRPAIATTGSGSSGGGGSAGVGGSGGGSGGGSASNGVTISAVYFDSPGPDTGTNVSRNAEWVQIHNATAAKNLAGWTIRDAQSHIYTFPSFLLGSGKSVEVHTGSGTNTSTNLYWGSASYVWNNTGDDATLKNSNGSTVASCSYSASADPETHC